MKYKKLSKVTQRAIEGGAIPPACGKVKHWKPKLRNFSRHSTDWRSLVTTKELKK